MTREVSHFNDSVLQTNSSWKQNHGVAEHAWRYVQLFLRPSSFSIKVQSLFSHIHLQMLQDRKPLVTLLLQCHAGCTFTGVKQLQSCFITSLNLFQTRAENWLTICSSFICGANVRSWTELVCPHNLQAQSKIKHKMVAYEVKQIWKCARNLLKLF